MTDEQSESQITRKEIAIYGLKILAFSTLFAWLFMIVINLQ